MIWYLIVCTTVNSGAQCLPSQRFWTKEACLFMGEGYKKLGIHDHTVRYTCRGIPQ